jgi:hypothetical protein
MLTSHTLSFAALMIQKSCEHRACNVMVASGIEGVFGIPFRPALICPRWSFQNLCWPDGATP